MTYTLKDEVYSAVDLFEEVYWRLESDVRLMIPTQEILNFKNIYITGSGDSYLAGLSTEEAFLNLSKIHTRAYPSLTYSRYYLDNDVLYPEKNNLSIAISNSGTAARVIEAQTKAKNVGYKTVALSRNGSPLSEISDYVYNTDSEKMGFAPGVRSFVVMQLALYLLAIRLGEVKANYTMDVASNYRNKLFSVKDLINDELTTNHDKLEKFSKIIDKYENAEILASGSMHGVSEFMAATIIEAVGYQSAGQDIEEFGHVNFFRNNPSEIPTIIMLPSNSKSASRGYEIIDALESLGRPYLIITDKNTNVDTDQDNVIALDLDLEEMFAPLVYGFVASYLVSLLNESKEADYFRNHEGVYDESKVKRPSESVIVL